MGTGSQSFPVAALKQLTGGLPSRLPPDASVQKGPGQWQEGRFGVGSRGREEFCVSCQ